MNLKQITDISQVKEVYTECMASIQDKISGSDFLIVFDEKNRKEMISILKYPYTGQILTYL